MLSKLIKISNLEGNTCKEARERGLEMLNGPFMIADYSPPVCQSENETLFEVGTIVFGPQNDLKNNSSHQCRILIDFFHRFFQIKKWSWNGGCSCLNPFTGQSIMHSNIMEQCRDPDFCPTFE